MASADGDACERVAQACARGDFVNAVRLMGAHATDARLLARACQVLGDAVVGDVAGKLAAVAAGALEAVVAALETFPGDASVQEHGSAAIFTLLACEHAEDPHSKAVAARANAAVLSALRMRALNASVVANGFSALANLVFKNLARQTDAAAAGALAMVATALLSHATVDV
jgi:hypothetical protein